MTDVFLKFPHSISSVFLNNVSRGLVFFVAALISSVGIAEENAEEKAPPVQLARVYSEALPASEYLVSEKYDGVRAIWKNGQLLTRKGKAIHAPQWFTEDLPPVWLDGELWSKRQDFEFIASAVRKISPVDKEWRQIRYMVFDAPSPDKPFSERVASYTALLDALDLSHVKPVQQFSVSSNAQLSNLLMKYSKAGAEGLMLHHPNAMFVSGRSTHLLKLKPYMDDEAVVVGHIEGKGKYRKMLGALRVRWRHEPSGEERIFKIGTGFSDFDRKSPPKIGSVITFKYHGLTKYRVPRFASFLRERK